jgi:hypothetical protein
MATEQHQESPHELLASERKPVTDATLTIRIIKSFEYRTMKPLVLKDLDLTTLTVGELLEKCKAGKSDSWWNPWLRPWRF